MNACAPLGALHMRLLWIFAMHVQQREPDLAAAIRTDLMMNAYRDGALAHRLDHHAPPLSIADNTALAHEWTCGHNDAARGAHVVASDFASPRAGIDAILRRVHLTYIEGGV